MAQIIFKNVSCTNILRGTYSGVTGGGRGAGCPSETSDREISADLLGKKRKGKKEKGWKLRSKEGKL